MSTADQPANAARRECSVRGMTGGKFHPLCPVHGMPLIDLGRRHGVPADPEADERLRLDLAAIAEAERQALAPSSRRCDESCTVDCGRCKGQPLRDLRKRVIVALGFQRVLLGFLAKYREPTRGNYYTDLQGYAAWCEQQNYKMLGVGPLELQLYIEYLRGRGLAEATIGRRYGTVSSLLKYAYRLEVIPKNPADFVDRPTVNRALQKTPRLSPLELADVIRQARRHSRPVNTYHRNLALVLLMGFMGLRVGEVCGLNIEGVIESEGQPAIRFIGKRQKVATMVLPWAALQAIKATIGDRTSGPVFVKMQGVHKGDRLTRPDVAHVIEALCARAGIDRHITPHSFRRSFAKVAHMQGRQLHEIQEALRHVDPKMTGHYIGTETTGAVATQAVSAFMATLSV